MLTENANATWIWQADDGNWPLRERSLIRGTRGVRKTMNITDMDSESLCAYLDSIADPVLILDVDLEVQGPTILFANQAYEMLTGFGAEHMHGRVFGARDSVSGHVEETEIHRCLRENRRYHGELDQCSREGLPLRLLWRVTAYPDEASPRYFVAIGTVPQNEGLKYADTAPEVHYLSRVAHPLAVMTSGSPDEVRNAAVEMARSAVNGDAAVIVQPMEDMMACVATDGITSEFIGLRLPAAQSLAGWCYRSGSGAWRADVAVTQNETLKTICERVGFRACVAAPVFLDSQVIGVLKVFWRHPMKFRDDDGVLMVRSLSTVGALYGYACQKANEKARQHILLNAMKSPVMYFDRDGFCREVNSASLVEFNARNTDILGHHADTIFENIDHHVTRDELARVIGGEHIIHESHVIQMNAIPECVDVEYVPHRGVHNQVEGFYVLLHQRTDGPVRVDGNYDHLTGLYNRKMFDEYAAELTRMAERYERPLSLVMIDIDHFRDINDKYGHLVGDEILMAIADIVRSSVRISDVVARWGGEELAVLVPETNGAAAKQLGESLRREIKRYTGIAVDHITASIGVTEFTPGSSVKDFVGDADEALYCAKKAGRDRVECKRCRT